MSREEIYPLLPGLLVWIQDMNWPIAANVAELLLSFPKEIVPYVKNVLATNDNVWKYWCLVVLVKQMPLDSWVLFEAELISLVESPTVDEKLEELDQIAIGILETIQ